MACFRGDFQLLIFKKTFRFFQAGNKITVSGLKKQTLCENIFSHRKTFTAGAGARGIRIAEEKPFSFQPV